ncbi:GGDEF domain-containing protein [Pseudomaricurvus alkylphenolicus]|uniref:diguanylate cyclase n=1 Tax=Pseudomaricurvus alkylphenolicus TaxID=1306991 RepID=UPI00141F0541|nr:GGDEF domain-containing protein [Pseudomaricurvus alkylphenolicus]NIB45039.1 GGDEF domain-containing protein [Pseudomaricurvus alkylphenolicus]
MSDLPADKDLLAALFSVIPDLFFFVEPCGKIVYYQAGNTRDLYKDPSEFMHKRMQDVLPENVGDKFDHAMTKAAATCQLQVLEYELRISDELKFFEARLNKLPNKDIIPIIIRDVTPRMKAEQLLARYAYYDAVTEIPNRRFTIEFLEKQVADCGRRGEAFAVAFVDLNEFKSVNDTFGHRAGDLLLKEVATRLKNSLRASDTVTRIGGDEFVILLGGDPTDAAVLSVLNKVLHVAEKPVILGEEDKGITTPKLSIGVAFFPYDSQDGSELLSFSDAAMYHAKTSSTDSISFFKELGVQTQK